MNQFQLSPEHLDLAVRAIGALPYTDVHMLMDAIRIQVHAQNEVQLKRMQDLQAQEVEVFEVGAIH